MNGLHAIVIICLALIGAGTFVLVQKDSNLDNNTIESPTSIDAENDKSSVEEVVKTTIETEPLLVPQGKTLDLRNQGIKEVSRSVFDRKDIETLLLSGNNLTSLQAEIRQMSNLRVLDLSNNTMTNIPAELGQLSKLEVLDLSNNRLTGLPYELGNLSNLKTLDLRGNQYNEADLDFIRRGLPSSTNILTD